MPYTLGRAGVPSSSRIHIPVRLPISLASHPPTRLPARHPSSSHWQAPGQFSAWPPQVPAVTQQTTLESAIAAPPGTLNPAQHAALQIAGVSLSSLFCHRPILLHHHLSRFLVLGAGCLTILRMPFLVRKEGASKRKLRDVITAGGK